MYDDLSRIENCYGSVAEYNRSRADDETHEYELAAKRWESYRAAKENLKRASEENLPIIYYGGYTIGCHECDKADHNTCVDDDDDVERVICRNGSLCKNYKKVRAKELAGLFNFYITEDLDLLPEWKENEIAENILKGDVKQYYDALSKCTREDKESCLKTFKEEVELFVKGVR